MGRENRPITTTRGAAGPSSDLPRKTYREPDAATWARCRGAAPLKLYADNLIPWGVACLRGGTDLAGCGYCLYMLAFPCVRPLSRDYPTFAGTGLKPSCTRTTLLRHNGRIGAIRMPLTISLIIWQGNRTSPVPTVTEPLRHRPRRTERCQSHCEAAAYGQDTALDAICLLAPAVAK